MRPFQHGLLVQQPGVGVRGAGMTDLATGQETKGVEAVVGVDEHEVGAGGGDVEDGVGGGRHGVGAAALDVAAAVEGYDDGAEGLACVPGSGVEAEIEAVL